MRNVSFGRDNVNDHRAAAIDLQAGKAARPAAPCASYCYPASFRTTIVLYTVSRFTQIVFEIYES